MKALRLAIVGAGHLGKIHARIASRQPGVELVAIVDRDKNAAAPIAKELGAIALTDCRELLAACEPKKRRGQANTSDGCANADLKPGVRIDAAIVATPTTSHCAVGGELLDSGISVLVEKPLAKSPAEGTKLVDRAAAAGVVLQVGHVERFNPAFVAAKPDIADPKYIVAERLSGYPGRSLDIGVVLDLMIHDLDIVLSLVDSPVRHVDALGVSVFGRHEDMANARVTFDCGCVVNLTASRVSTVQKRTMQVFSAGGSASIDFAQGESTLLRPSKRVSRREIDATSLPSAEMDRFRANLFAEDLVREIRTPPAANAIAAEQRDFFDCVRTGGAPRVRGAAGRDALVLAERICGAIDAHMWDGRAEGRVGPFAAAQAPALRPAA